MNTKNPEFLGRENIPSLIIKFMIPSIIGLVVHSLNNVVDRIFVGHAVGYLGISGIAFSFPVLVILFGIGLFIANGTCVLLSIKLGEKKEKIANKIFNNGIYYGVIFSIATALLGLFFTPGLLSLLEVSDDILPYANDYAFIMFVGSFTYILSIIFSFAIVAEGSPKTSMVITIVSALINILFNYIFVICLHYGVKGSAFSTLIGEGSAVLFSVIYYFSKHSILKLKLKEFRFGAKIIYKISMLGFPSFMKFAFISFQFIFMNILLIEYGGSIAVAASGIVFVVTNICYLILGGITDAMRPIVSYNYGALEFKRAKSAFYYSQSFGIISFFICLAIVVLFPNAIIHLFETHNQQLIDMTKIGLMITFTGVLIDMIYGIGVLFLQSIDRAKAALWMTLLKQCFTFFPLLLLLPKLLGLNGIWMTNAVGGVVSFIIAAPFFWREFKRLETEHPEPL